MGKLSLDEDRSAARWWTSRRNVVITALTMGLAGTAVADTGFVATLAQPLAARKEIIVGGNIFRCEGSTCVLASNSSAAETVGTCRTLQRKVGTLTGYVAAGKPFDGDKLAKCNAP